jgi:acetyl esterase/lipase
MRRCLLPLSVRLLAIAAFASALPAAALAPEPNEREREQLQVYQQPNAWFLERLKVPSEVVDGQTLHPKIQYYAESRGRTEAGRQSSKQQEVLMDTPEGRAMVRISVDRTWNYRTKVTEDMAAVEDRTVAGRGGPIAVRLYRPNTGGKGPLPVLLYMHGGAWLFGSIDAVDRAVRLIANEAKMIVVSVNYRLAPEHLYPAPQDDVEDAFRWTIANIGAFGGDANTIAVSGDSAGGQLALNVSQRQRKAKAQMPVYQLLYYPAVDLHTNTRSYQTFGEGYGLDRHLADFVFARVYPEKLRSNPEASPLLDSMKGMPPTILATPGFDILRDQGRLMAKKLERDGVPVTYLNYPSLTHGFLQHSGTIDDAETAAVETARLLGRAVRSRGPMLATAPLNAR